MSATTAGNQQPSQTHTGSCRLISACDASILSSVPERTAGKNFWQGAMTIAQQGAKSKIRHSSCHKHRRCPGHKHLKMSAPRSTAARWRVSSGECSGRCGQRPPPVAQNVPQHDGQVTSSAAITDKKSRASRGHDSRGNAPAVAYRIGPYFTQPAGQKYCLAVRGRGAHNCPEADSNGSLVEAVFLGERNPAEKNPDGAAKAW